MVFFLFLLVLAAFFVACLGSRAVPVRVSLELDVQQK
jgi:hypothetical protein